MDRRRHRVGGAPPALRVLRMLVRLRLVSWHHDAQADVAGPLVGDARDLLHPDALEATSVALPDLGRIDGEPGLSSGAATGPAPRSSLAETPSDLGVSAKHRPGRLHLLRAWASRCVLDLERERLLRLRALGGLLQDVIESELKGPVRHALWAVGRDLGRGLSRPGQVAGLQRVLLGQLLEH
jgi:hypothetical protein